MPGFSIPWIFFSYSSHISRFKQYMSWFIQLFRVHNLVGLIKTKIALGVLVSPNETAVLATGTQCIPCPFGASCESGGSSIAPLPGFWADPVLIARRATSATNNIELYKCLPGGHYSLNAGMLCSLRCRATLGKDLIFLKQAHVLEIISVLKATQVCQ